MAPDDLGGLVPAADEGPVVEGDERHLVGEPLAPDLGDGPRLDPALGVVGHRFRLDLDHDPGPPVNEGQRLGEGRDPLALPCVAEALGVSRRQGADVLEGHPPHVAPAGGGAVHLGVVEDHDLPVGGELDVELEDAGADLEGAGEGGQGVLGPVGGVAAVGDDQGEAPRGHWLRGVPEGDGSFSLRRYAALSQMPDSTKTARRSPSSLPFATSDARMSRALSGDTAFL